MKEINYKRILEQLIKEYPHELDKIEKVVNDAKESKQYDVSIEFDQIIKSTVWNSDEKARLLTFFGYSKHEHDIKYINEYHNTDTMQDYLYTIKHNILSGFEALMKIYKDIERHYDGLYITKDEAYRKIFEAVIYNCKDEDKVTYLKAILDNLTVEDIERLITPYYKGDHISNVHNESIFIHIIASKNLDLIKEYIDYVDDINMYLSEAVATGSIEIVEFFLKKKADINYVTDEVILGRLTPLKTAIANNDYNMVEFLLNNGADVNLQVKSDDFINRLNNYQIDVNERDFLGRMCRYRLDPVNEEDKNAKNLRYIRESSPLEYSTKLNEKNYKYDHCYNRYDVYFEGTSYTVNNRLFVDMHRISDQVKNRGKIVDLIFDKLEEKTTINYNDLIVFTFITRDAEKFKKYTKYVIDNNYQVDFDLLFKLYFEFHIEDDKEMLMPLMDLIAKYDKDSDIYLKLFDYYFNSETKGLGFYKFNINDFNKTLLNKIPQEKRKNICLVPYCKGIDSLQQLLSLGFDINQVDEKGKNILYYLLCNRHRKDDLKESEIELFKYLLKKLNLSMKDNDNKTALYYAMKKFDTEKEYQYADKNRVGTRSNLEKAVAILISKMPKKSVCTKDIQKVLEERLEYRGNKIHFEYVYQHHKELFDALIDKGFVLSDKVLNNIFESLYPQEEWKKRRLSETVDIESTLDFLYQRLDHNLEIQVIDIEKETKDLSLFIDRQDITFEEFLKKFIDFNNKITSLKLFYENNIKKRFKPERYLQYAKEKYNTTYENLDSYLLLIIIKTISRFGNDKLTDILDLIPNYNINHYVIEQDVGLNYWSYREQIFDTFTGIYNDEHFEAECVYEDDNDNIVFTGGLMQYAILTDNLPMVQLLQERGATLNLSIDGENYTWNYVNSYTMLNYLESFVGKEQYRHLDDEEKDYYLSLVSSNNQDSDEQQKRLIMKKDGSN